ncbi:MAG: signal peptide peptidase SppA [Alphaproteobacteria bacterium]|nr:signal peptide peptidase SppA [Alphaproteobacteria bacterium]
MKQFVITVAGVLIGLILFAVLTPMALIAFASAAARPAPLPAASVLVLDLRTGLTDQPPDMPFAFLQGRGNSVLGIEQTLRRAGRDSAVKGLLVRLPEGGMAPAAADELRRAFLDFRAQGKPILAHSQGLYSDGTVVSTYELGAASGDLWMQPGASFQVTGLARDDVFLKRLFDRFGVVADYQQRYQYKTAVNPFLYDDYTPAHRESELSWMGSVFETSLVSAANDRRQNPKALMTLIEAGPYSAEEAKAKGLIDQVGEVKGAEDAILAKAGDGASLVSFNAYAAHARAARGRGVGQAGAPVIALIAAEGDIVTGSSAQSGGGPLSGSSAIHSDDVAKAFYDAIDDHDVKAIVFRVSSPGGSDTASEQILAAVRAAKAAGKPVVVSMGTYAASGGYWISSQASEIVAEPTTLTGSIGVFGGKFALGKALGRYGVDLRGLKVGGDFADAFSPDAPMSPSQRAAVSAWMDHIYQGFVARVAEGRHMRPDKVEAIAKGRVWTGAQAKALGLVDHIGDIYDAVDRAKALAHIQGPARLRGFNAEASPLDALRRMLNLEARGVHAAAALGSVLETPAAHATLETLDTANLRAQGSTVLAPRLVD